MRRHNENSISVRDRGGKYKDLCRNLGGGVVVDPTMHHMHAGT
jgi:hypothetical protein